MVMGGRGWNEVVDNASPSVSFNATCVGVRVQASNMPKDNIDAAIKRGVEGKAGSNMEAVQVCS